MSSGQARDIHCPRCKNVELEALLVEGVALDHCKKCGGIWLDHTVFARLQQIEANSAPLMLRIADLPKPQRTTNANKAYIPCPECKNLMTPRNFAGCSGVIIDECRSHGVWFDPGELAAIMQFIRDGGLDKARKRNEARIQDQIRQKEFGTALDRVRDARAYQGGDLTASDPGKDWPLDLAAQFLSALFS